jgi:lipopolysaccharide transport system permease protein
MEYNPKNKTMPSKSEIIITPLKPKGDYWRELWNYRDLFIILAWRDFKVRYRQTIIGVAWAVLRPLITMAVFTMLFSRIAQLPSGGDVPYAVMVFAAMLPWYFFASTLQESSQSLINSANIITKIYFPRIIIPASALFVNAIDFLISLVILFGLMYALNVQPTYKLVMLPGFFLQACMVATGAGFWLAALNVTYRDFRYVVPFMLQLGIYVSPVGFSSHLVPDDWRQIYAANPMVGVIDGFRWSLLGESVAIDWPSYWLSLAVGFLIFFSGIWYFQRVEQGFADVI